MKKEIPHTCGYCALYDKHNGVCSISVMVAGEEYELKVAPNDSCHLEAVSKEIGYDLLADVKQMRIFKDGNDVKIEYPDETIKRGM